MNRSFIPYHLRQNKAIDRALFVELLEMINRFVLIKDYQYISMGGPFLEDFKIIHSYTGIEDMLSFEMDENTYKRQIFNQPLRCIDLKHETSQDFILRYDFAKPVIIWLDFTTPLRMHLDLQDLFDLICKLKIGDVVKVTLNAHAPAIPCEGDSKGADLKRRRLKYLQNSLGDYLPAGITEDDVSQEQYPSLLLSTLRNVVDIAIDGTPNAFFQSLTSFVYADGQQMITFTGTILNRKDRDEFFEKTNIDRWELSIIGKDSPTAINLPDLSVRERMFLDSLMPNDVANVSAQLSYLFGKSEEISAEAITNYVRYYRQFPYFSKVAY